MSDPIPKPRWRRVLWWLYRQAKHLLALFGLGVIVWYGFFDLSHMTTRGMRPLLHATREGDGDHVLTERLTYRLRSPRRWELITYRQDDGRAAVRRVVGLPGETVQMLRGGKVVIDGRNVEKPSGLASIKYLPACNVFEEKKVACGDGYFVLGDESMDIFDSRFELPVTRNALIGRPWLIVAPRSRIGLISHKRVPSGRDKTGNQSGGGGYVSP
jgi:signal peptidase I